MVMLSIILLVWAIGCLLTSLLFMVGGRHRLHAPTPEPNPTVSQVNGVVEVDEILGMYERPIQ